MKFHAKLHTPRKETHRWKLYPGEKTSKKTRDKLPVKKPAIFVDNPKPVKKPATIRLSRDSYDSYSQVKYGHDTLN